MVLGLKKKIKAVCGFCKESEIHITENYSDFRGKRHKKIKVTGGYLVITTYNHYKPICSRCWPRAMALLESPDQFLSIDGVTLTTKEGGIYEFTIR